MDEITSAWYRRQSAVALASTRRVEALWGQVDADRISESWLELLPQAVTATTAGQVAAATQSTDYVSAQVRQQGVEPTPEGRVNPVALAGEASDGRPLESLLLLPAIFAKMRIAQGMPPTQALLSGRASLLSMVGTEVADAGKTATQVAMTADTTVKGYTRVVNLPACSRCIVLAGRTYKWNAGFLRHPGCDCTHRPYTTLEDAIADGPNAMFEQLTRAQQDKSFGKASAQAIRDGADISQVVNAKRGMSLPNTGAGARAGRTTTEGRSRRGAFARRSDARAMREGRTSEFTKVEGGRYRRIREERLSVDAIYWQAQGDRDEAIRMLRKYAYILD